MKLPPLDLAHPGLMGDPHGIYRAYRELGAVHYEGPSGAAKTGRYFLLRHADVLAGMNHPLLTRSARRALWAEERREIPPEHRDTARIFRQFVLFKDPPEHDRFRRPVNRILRRTISPGFRPWVAAEAEELAGTLPCEGTLDLVSRFTQVLVSRMIGILLGAGDDCTHQDIDEAATFVLLCMANRFQAERLATANARILQLEEFVRRRMEEPPESRPDAFLLHSIIHEANVSDLSPHEMRATAIFLLIAARDNVRSSLANAVWCLLRHPPTWQDLRRNPDDVPAAVEEVLRFEPAVHFASRHAAEDLEIAGVRISAGEGVTFGLAAASRDPEVFVHPDRFDPHRSPGPTAGFGFGIHRCPGIGLARILIEEGLRALLARWPDPKLAVSTDQLSWVPSSIFRMLGSLPLRVGQGG